MSSVYGAFDEYDRDKRAWLTSQGRRQKAKKGQVVGQGPAPYGYQYVTEWVEARKRHVPIGLKPDPETRAIVERIYRDALRWSTHDIAAQLTAEGIAPPADWTPSEKRPQSGRWAVSTIRRILKSSVYRGEWFFDDIPVSVPPLVDAVTWERVQGRLGERQRSRRGRGTERAALWTLRGMLTCGECGGLLSTTSAGIDGAAGATWPGGRMRRYTCARGIPSAAKANHWEPCSMTALLAADDRTSRGVKQTAMTGLEDLAWRYVVELYGTPGVFEARLTALREGSAEARAAWSERLAVMDGEIAGQERLMRRAEEEKIKLDDDDPRYQIHLDAGLRAAETLRKLRVERDRYVAAGTPGLSDDARAEMLRDVATIRALMGAAIEAATEHAPPAFRRRLFERLDLRGTVRRAVPGDADAHRVGRLARVTVEWSSVLGSGPGIKKLYALQGSHGVVLTAVE
jgi:hypothetical protein